MNGFIYFDPSSRYGEVVHAFCYNDQCSGYMQEQEYRSDACPLCGFLG